MALNPKMLSKMFKTSQRAPKNLGRMTEKEIRSEYARQSKVANKRIADLNKSGYYSHAYNELTKNGFKGKFGIKNQGLTDIDEIKTAYKELMGFLNSGTSSKSGIRQVIDTTNRNFGLSFDGNYQRASQRNKELFKIYDDLETMYEKGELNSNDKYTLVNELGQMYDSGELNQISSMDELVEIMNQRLANVNANVNNRYKQLKFNWKV